MYAYLIQQLGGFTPKYNWAMCHNTGWVVNVSDLSDCSVVRYRGQTETKLYIEMVNIHDIHTNHNLACCVASLTDTL